VDVRVDRFRRLGHGHDNDTPRLREVVTDRQAFFLRPNSDTHGGA
jgi:hypothetical protein